MRARLVVAVLLVAGAGVAYPAPVGAEALVAPYFVDVACPSATSCFAVGNAFTSSSGITKTFVERWNGTTWSVMATPDVANPSETGGSIINDVACATPTSCFVVGYAATRKGVRLARRPFAERWNGKAFSIVPSGLPQGATDTRLFGVKCRTAADCVAVGQTGGTALVEHWNGAAWSIAAESDAAGKRFEELDSVSCPTVTRCIAVGSYVTSFVAPRSTRRWIRPGSFRA